MRFPASFNICVIDMTQIHAVEAGPQACQRLFVAYSGGIDSGRRASEDHQVLEADVLAMIADLPLAGPRQLKDAITSR